MATVYLHISLSNSKHDHLLVPFYWHSSVHCFNLVKSTHDRKERRKRLLFTALTEAYKDTAGGHARHFSKVPLTAGCICPSACSHLSQSVSKCQVLHIPAQVCVCTVCVVGGGFVVFLLWVVRWRVPAVAFSPLIVMITGWPSHSAWYWARNSTSDIMWPAGWRASRLYSRGRRGNL